MSKAEKPVAIGLDPVISETAEQPAGSENPAIEVQDKGGRPSKYTPELVATICERLSKGEPLAAICREEGMPGSRTVRDWEAQRPEVSAAIARAREEGEDAMAAECLDIADETSRDTLKDEHGNERANTEWISRSKLRIDTRLKLLAKFNPKKWGDKLDLTTAGQALVRTRVIRPGNAAK